MFCKRCGRKLRSTISIARGYGNSCYAKVGGDQKKSNNTEKISDVNFVDELKSKVS